MIKKQILRILSFITRAFRRTGPGEFYAESFDFRSGLGDSAWLLYGLTRSLKPTTCVEIGSARGRSACSIGLALRRNGRGKLYAIDPHAQTNWNDTNSVDSLDIFKFHIEEAGVSDYVEVVRKNSVDAALKWRKDIDLIFIDGDHSYEGVKNDWELFVPHLSKFGVVVFHDTIWDLRPDPEIARPDMGVPRFVNELRKEGYPVITLDKNFGVSLVQFPVGGISLSNDKS